KEPRDAAVEAVEHTGKDDRSEGFFPLAADCEADACQAETQSERGDSIGNHRTERDPPRIPVLGHWLSPTSGASSPTSARMVSPATVRCPSRTLGAVPAGRNTS